MILKFVAIFILFIHGLGHSMGMMPGWTQGQKALVGTPWLIPFESGFAKFWGFVWLTVVIMYMVTVVGMLLKSGWWPGWLIAATILSIIAILPWWNTLPWTTRIGALAVDVVTLYLMWGPVKESFLKLFS